MTCTIEPFSIEAAYPAPVRRFLHSLGMCRKRNSMSGLIFNGPQLNKLTRESSFSLLEREFANESDAAQDLLRHCLQHCHPHSLAIKPHHPSPTITINRLHPQSHACSSLSSSSPPQHSHDYSSSPCSAHRP